ncbi:MAG: quinone-dependent dihydroorotate dehydrogenase [Propionibacteriaceae bacterium]|jgi:dihydroorotate dehydrogenase|nr:quinone-dependent dihydroorotate dehydrogenase [Propionibacteriaceae bacterium]
MSWRAGALTLGYQRLLRPILFRSWGGDPERAHEATIKLLGGLGAEPWRQLVAAVLPAAAGPIRLAGIDFPGRVGLAAGLDKDGQAARVWAALGFGFAELGTVTARAQPGNDRPRLFRAPHSAALINRMGFNNSGAAELARRLTGWGQVRGQSQLGLPLGISIGKTKAVGLDQAQADYLACLVAVAPVADYVAVNVSSPNTPGLRRLQSAQALAQLLTSLVQAAPADLPIFVKLTCDLAEADLDQAVEAATAAGVAGFIATNTSLERHGLKGPDCRLARQAGGLSGAPLAAAARRMVARLSGLTDRPIIGSGGVMGPSDAQALFDVGASLVQIYTGLIYSGPGLVAAINDLVASRADQLGPATREGTDYDRA